MLHDEAQRVDADRLSGGLPFQTTDVESVHSSGCFGQADAAVPIEHSPEIDPTRSGPSLMRRRVGLAAKRAIDLVGATVGLVVLSPLLAWVALVLLAIQGRPILFRHQRPGFHGEPFILFKFRTMRPPDPDEVWYRTDERRTSRIGRFLRSSSIDELPGLINVLRGEMSLVGPRPLLMEYLDEYTPEEHRRHDMRPGVTSWAAVNGRHILNFKDRLSLDVWYIDHWSLWLDVRILAKTVAQVLRRTDVAAAQDLDEVGFPLPGVGRAGGGEAGGVPPDAPPPS